MVTGQQNFERIAAETYLGWWRDVGVDIAVCDEPYDWLGSAIAKAPTSVAPLSPVGRPIPQTLTVFLDYLMTGQLGNAGPTSQRIRPSGDPASNLMILTDFPDVSDVVSGVLLDDPLFTNMLAAIGHSRDTVYIASLCPGRPVTGQLSEDCFDEFAELARQHIALAVPTQLWLVGSAASRAILGIDDSAARGKLHSVNHHGRMIDAIATAHPRMFSESKSRKAAAWTEMQRLLPKDKV